MDLAVCVGDQISGTQCTFKLYLLHLCYIDSNAGARSFLSLPIMPRHRKRAKDSRLYIVHHRDVQLLAVSKTNKKASDLQDVSTVPSSLQHL